MDFVNTASFRDPDGFIFHKNREIYRQINKQAADDFEFFISSHLYDELAEQEKIIKFSDADISYSIEPETVYKIIKPEKIPFISYPYEWSFSQLKDAALLTLDIQRKAVEKGMSLKDASAYNIQFLGCRPLHIDTLSFEKLQEGKPWVAYGQFCRHFLAPLALCAYKDIRLNLLLKNHLDGIPLDMASKLLPFSSYFNLSVLVHLHLHSKAETKYSALNIDLKDNKKKIDKLGLLGILDSLESAVSSLKMKNIDTEWSNYYEETNYTQESFNHKKIIVDELIKTAPKEKGIAIDFGANNGAFSRLLSKHGFYTIAMDMDLVTVEKNFHQCKKDNEKNILPLVMDLFNPSPSIGWMQQERKGLMERCNADLGLALALIHHLAISNNLPFYKIAEFFYENVKNLIIEFVPKHDSQVQKMLLNRGNTFENYTEEMFDKNFARYFNIKEKINIKHSLRKIYLMEKK